MQLFRFPSLAHRSRSSCKQPKVLPCYANVGTHLVVAGGGHVHGGEEGRVVDVAPSVGRGEPLGELAPQQPRPVRNMVEARVQ